MDQQLEEKRIKRREYQQTERYRHYTKEKYVRYIQVKAMNTYCKFIIEQYEEFGHLIPEDIQDRHIAFIFNIMSLKLLREYMMENFGLKICNCPNDYLKRLEQLNDLVRNDIEILNFDD